MNLSFSAGKGSLRMNVNCVVLTELIVSVLWVLWDFWFLLSVRACECCQSLLLPASSALYCCRCECSLYHTITSLIPGTLLSACLYLSLSLSRRALVGKPCGNSGSNSVAILKCFTKTKHFILPLFSDGRMLDERQKQAKERREERAKYLGKTAQRRQWDSTTCCLGSRCVDKKHFVIHVSNSWGLCKSQEGCKYLLKTFDFCRF